MKRLARRLTPRAGARSVTTLAEHEAVVRLRREGPAPLEPASEPGSCLRVAFVIPPFRRGSGGHATIANLVRGLEARGHSCSLWLYDPAHAIVASFEEFFGPLQGPVHTGFDAWTGADVAVSTGWQTVHRTLLLPGCVARAYLVQDHEPEFFPTSAERRWAEETYRLGLHHIAAGTWLAELLAERYGASASSFDLGVDAEAYGPRDARRREDFVVFYARAATPRRALPLGLLALAELHERRPDVELALFGEPQEIALSFPARQLGVLDHGRLARLYAEATVGVVLSMTNHSLIPQEMLASGLPCVELDTPSARAAFGADGPVEFAPLDPFGLARAIERLLEDPALRERRAVDGRALAAERTWARAAEQVEHGLREALER